MEKMHVDFDKFPRSRVGSMLNMLCSHAEEDARSHGFYAEHESLVDFLSAQDAPDKCAIAEANFVLAQLSEVCCELGEAVDAFQRHEEAHFHDELADVVIHLFSLAGYLHIRLGDRIMLKMAINHARPWMHGKPGAGDSATEGQAYDTSARSTQGPIDSHPEWPAEGPIGRARDRSADGHDSCDGCRYDLGGGRENCRLNLAYECRDGGGFEARKPEAAQQADREAKHGE